MRYVVWVVAVLLVGCEGEMMTMGPAGADSGPGSSRDARAGADGGGATGRDAGPGVDSGAMSMSPADCSSPDPSWLLCEDFEAGGGEWDAWFAATDFVEVLGGDDRGRVTLSDVDPHAGSYSAYMPAEAGSGHQGASLDWWDCAGEQRTNCALESHDALYFRVFVKFAEDHRYVHHFLNISGSQPDDFWYHGTAGCLPNGELAMGTTVDHREGSHESFFYTYHPGMTCDTRCDRYADVAAICADCASKGLPTCDEQPQCCWGNYFEAEAPVAFPVGRWFCFEMMMRANTPGEPDGSMAYWVDGTLAHQEDGMMWRTSPTLALNRVRVQHYVTTGDAEGHSNRVWFDDVVVSTQPIGCERF